MDKITYISNTLTPYTIKWSIKLSKMIKTEVHPTRNTKASFPRDVHRAPFTRTWEGLIIYKLVITSNKSVSFCYKSITMVTELGWGIYCLFISVIIATYHGEGTPMSLSSMYTREK